MNFRTLIKTKEYDFLRTNEHLKDNIILLTLGGSHAYGTNTEGSDVDIRGCALNRPQDILGFGNFEHFRDNATDTTLYAFNQMAKLLVSCNPNAVEMLGCKPEHYLVLTKEGQALIDNRKLFLSKMAINSFGRYAAQQLRHMENILAWDGKIPQTRKEEHVLHALKRSVKSMEDQHKELTPEGITMYLDESDREGFDIEAFADIDLKHYPARGFIALARNLNNVIATYENNSHRNHKKDDVHLNKHAMHLVRLFLTGIDILEKGDIITHREADLDLLMSIRRGDYQNPDGSYRTEFFDMVTELETRLQYAAENTSLPATPDIKRVEELVMAVNASTIDRRRPLQRDLSHIAILETTESCGPFLLGDRSILFNENKIGEKEAYRCVAAGRYSPYVLKLPKEQYQGLFLDVDVVGNKDGGGNG